jgi:hypothetical protein
MLSSLISRLTEMRPMLRIGHVSVAIRRFVHSYTQLYRDSSARHDQLNVME